MTRFSKISLAALALVAVGMTACTVDDLNSPVITLEGNDPAFLRIGTAWTEPGATAEDVEDGPISLITVDDTGFDPNTMGTYTLTYSATDDAGNVGTATRTVHVYVNSADLVGSYDVDEECEGGITDAYAASVNSSVDTANVIIENFFGVSGLVISDGITLSGNTQSTITVDATGGGADFDGTGTVTSAVASGGSVAVEFTITYVTDDGVNPPLECTAVYTKN